ncbi:hypothetical protein PCO86_08090 [Pectobacteriaceae bacterium CE70]|nr:hypothetical protein PCO87_07870 [Pectobacteriaceae bacterium C52]WJV68346.1 hypothetical protein PCO86_08090 [Pectobacteriaceae bacterium CE70]WJY12276.1 hypothetical protein PCO80_07935 [Pectobacteriaceae bacterium C80]
MMIINKDALRAKVEAESQGRRTVLYTVCGQPSYMYVMPSFTMKEVATGLGDKLHPAFTVHGRGITEFFYGCYPGSIHQGELLSLPNQEPASGLNLPAFREKVMRNGPGWHLGTNAEWSALMFWCRHHQFAEDGNTHYGRSHRAVADSGRRVEGEVGSTDGNPTTLTASGPAGWYHAGSPDGIGDLCGNLWEWQEGARLHQGEIQVIRDNDAAAGDVEQTVWWAVDINSGALVTPGSFNSAKFESPDNSRMGNAGTPVLSSRILNFNGEPRDSSNTSGLMDGAFNDIQMQNHLAAPQILQTLGIAPWHQQADGDQVYLRNYGERALLRGGAWYSGEYAGLRTLCLSHTADHASSTVGARPAFYQGLSF